jgi:precorrin-3B synthase
MTAAPAIKGWCPTLLAPMQSGDGWLARVKPSAGVITAAAARTIAHAASRHGNGHIDLTAHGNLQVRGLTPHSAELLAEAIIAAGLASEQPAVEAIRNVMASPLGPDDPNAAFDSHALTRDIEAMLAAEPALQALPPKFCVLVDGGGALPLAGVAADIMVRAHGEALGVRLDGGTLAAPCSPRALAETVRAVALAFLHLSWERREPPRRMAALVGEIGAAAIFADAGLDTVPTRDAPSTPPRAPVGFISIPARAACAFGVGLPFGRIEAAALAALADLSERHGDGSLRTTPWRTLLLVGVAEAKAATLDNEIEALGLIAAATDPRLDIFACVGAPACHSASVDARGDGCRLAATIATSKGRSIHVSGCAKSCAHRGSAAVTLVGRDGRYDLIRDGSTTDRPALAGLGIDEVLALLQSVGGRQP